MYDNAIVLSLGSLGKFDSHVAALRRYNAPSSVPAIFLSYRLHPTRRSIFLWFRAAPLFIDDDTEDAPWMVVPDWQAHATTHFFILLQQYASRLTPPLYVAAMLPIRYHPVPGNPRIQQLAPDIFVSRVDPHFRSSYRLEEEGIVPAFVLEVISQESRQRDTQDKRRAYEAMGVEEYLLFDSVGGLLTPRMQGYRREGERLVEWERDDEGRLWSEVLGAWLTMVGDELRLVRQDGTLEPSPTEAREEVQRLSEELARLQASLERRDSDED